MFSRFVLLLDRGTFGFLRLCRCCSSILLWEFSKKTIQNTLGASPVRTEEIVRSMTVARELLAEVSPSAKIKMVRLFSPSSQRARLLEEKRWALEEYPVFRLGTVLPYVGDLPIEEIVKSFAEVADFVRQQAERESASTSVRYICSLSRIADILQTIPVMVIEPGSEQRRPDVMKERGREDLPIFPAEGYIEYGNHRALAQALADPNGTAIPSYVGRAV